MKNKLEELRKSDFCFWIKTSSLSFDVKGNSYSIIDITNDSITLKLNSFEYLIPFSQIQYIQSYA